MTVGTPTIADAGGPRRADTAAWLAVFAGTLGALMAALDVSVVNSSLPTIQGEIGASGSEGTWIATAYLVAEIIIIPLAGWLERVFGLRNLLLAASSLFVIFSMMCGLSTSLTMMIIARAGQGFAGGALIPTAQTIIATRLPREQQPIGTVMFTSTVVLGPLVGPIVGGWLTENLSWHYAFFLNLPIGGLLITLLILGLPPQKAHFDRLRDADWLGIAGMMLGLGAMTVVLEDGQREQWFNSTMIRWLSLMSAIGLFLVVVGQFRAQRPVIRLALLRDRQVGSVVIMVMLLGMAVVGTSYAIPQFLSLIAGYNALQAGMIVLLPGLPVLFMLPITPFLMRTLDIRLSVATGLVVLALSAWLETSLAPGSSGADFAPSQILRGVGAIFASMYLNQAAIRSVAVEYAGDAAGLVNCARNLGGSLSLAAIGILQDQRVWLHSRRIEETLAANSASVQDYVNAQGQAADGTPAALQSLASTIHTQALTMAFADIFWLMSIVTMLTVPLAFFLKPLSQRPGPPVAVH